MWEDFDDRLTEEKKSRNLKLNWDYTMEEWEEKWSRIDGLRGLCSFTIGEPEGETDKVFEEKNDKIDYLSYSK